MTCVEISKTKIVDVDLMDNGSVRLMIRLPYRVLGHIQIVMSKEDALDLAKRLQQKGLG